MEKLSTVVPLNEKRLLSVEEFQIYSSLGRNTAFRLIHSTGIGIRVGRRLLVDRKKFDDWCAVQ